MEKNRYEKQIIVHGFLSCLKDEYKLEWHLTIEDTYDMLIKKSTLTAGMRHLIIESDMASGNIESSYIWRN